MSLAQGPVIVLAPAYCGASMLRSLLAGHADLACTTGTGLLPLCEQAIATWRSADRRPSGPPSQLATTATRALAASIITSILAREGKPRWCEIAAPNSQAAATFLGLYPQTRFLCLYRACPGVIRGALDASPWGLTDPVFAPYVNAYPASTVASLTAYWVAATGSLLAFEREYPRSCLRVRFEDLASARHETAETATTSVTAFLGLAGIRDRPGPADASQPPPASEHTGPQAGFPAGLIPPRLLAEANDLLRQLSYPVLSVPRTD